MYNGLSIGVSERSLYQKEQKKSGNGQNPFLIHLTQPNLINL
jgi:hypothetical protein